ncbi:MAG: hypothetical protein AB1426_05390 [Bacillota bacterium]
MNERIKDQRILRKVMSVVHGLRRLFLKVLLVPLIPVFWWGPVTHPYINYKALKRAEEEAASGDPKINRDLLSRLQRNRDIFIFSGNSADCIATQHILTRSPVYDYSHNSIPDCPSGLPLFGYNLINEWFDAQRGTEPYPEEDLAVACGWLAHQLADWYAHYAPVDGHGEPVTDPCAQQSGAPVFEGYANSHRVLGADFYPEILQQYRLIDHALVEFFYDMLIFHADVEGRFNTNRLDFFRNYRVKGRHVNLLTVASERFRGAAARIHPGEISVLRENLRTIIKGIRMLIQLSTFVRPELPDTISRSLSPQAAGPDYVGLSVERVLNGLFRKSYKEISLLADPTCAADRELYPAPVVIREVMQPGTLLFRFAHRLGSFLPDGSPPFYRGPDDFSLRFLKVFELRGKIAAYLTAGLAVEKITALAGTEDENALLAFCTMLLSTPQSDLNAARVRFRALLQPVVELIGDPDASDEQKLTVMLNSGEISVRIIPAVALNEPSSRLHKGLDMASLRFYLDGYDVRTDDRYELRLIPVDNCCLKVRVKLKEGIAEGYHRLTVTIKDNYGVAAKPFERDFWVGPVVHILR